MRIGLDESIELEFDPWSLEAAGLEIERISHSHKAHPTHGQDVLDAMLTLLLFAQVERSQPGTMSRLTNMADIYKKMQEPPAEPDK